MFELDKQMERWRSELRASHRYDPSDIDELEAHVLDQMEDLKAKGLTEEEAFWVAVHRVGDVDSLNREFSKLIRRKNRRRSSILSGVAALVLIAAFAIWWVNRTPGPEIAHRYQRTPQEMMVHAVKVLEDHGWKMPSVAQGTLEHGSVVIELDEKALEALKVMNAVRFLSSKGIVINEIFVTKSP
jgi:hypothetical protein